MTERPSSRNGSRSLSWRLILSVWLVFVVHATTNVVRETYLAITLGSQMSVRVDEYLGLHPDLFEIPGRGAYINNNPGASMLAAVPYGLIVRPVIDVAVRLRPGIAAPKPPARYDDPRPNRTAFLNAARARGLDIVLGLAALGIQATVMAPLGALGALLMFLFLRARLGDPRTALWGALLYAFATPIFFRSAFLNQNAIIAHLVLGAFVALAGLRPRPATMGPSRRALLAAGALLGFAVVCDYSGVPLLLIFGLWALADGWPREGIMGALRQSTLFAAGAVAPILLLLAYQWAAFGNPLWPAQRYMPPTTYSVHGWFGFSVPSVELLARNLFDPRYGLFTFSPLLLASLASPFVRRGRGGPTAGELGWMFAACAGLWLFSSANQFAHLQWNTGVRYMVPATPLLFVAALPALLQAPALVRWALVAASVAVSWASAMTRENIPVALGIVWREGLVLPLTTVLERVSSGYGGLAAAATLAPLIYLSLVVVLWLLWRRETVPAQRGREEPARQPG